MALPTYGFQCPSTRGTAFGSPQVGAAKGLNCSSKFGGSTHGLLQWRRRCTNMGPQRSRIVKVLAMVGKKERGKGDQSERQEVKLEAADMMELEFGRLLGEPRQATLAKVIGRKLNPEVSYIEIERKPLKKIQGSPSSKVSSSSKGSTSSKLSEAEFSRLLTQEARPNARPNMFKPAAQKPAAVDSENLPGLAPPPARPEQRVPKDSRRTPSVSSAQSSSVAQGKKRIPLVTFEPGGFAAQNKKSRPEDDYAGLVQKPRIPSPDSYKPSWPKNNIIPPMVIGETKRSLETVDDSLLRRPKLGEKSMANDPSDGLDGDLEFKIRRLPFLSGKPSLVKPRQSMMASPAPKIKTPTSHLSEMRFAQLLELAGSSDNGEDQEVRSDMPTTSSVEFVDSSSKLKEPPTRGPKAVPAAKTPLQPRKMEEGFDDEDSLISTRSDDALKASSSSPTVDLEMSRLEEKAEPMLSFPDVEQEVDLRGSDLDSTDLGKADRAEFDSEGSILRLVKKASRIVPVRPPKLFSPSIPDQLKAKLGYAVPSVGDRLAGWSDEVKAAVRRSEAALPSSGTKPPSETDFDQLLQRRKTELRQRPVPPPIPEPSPDPIEVGMRQLSASRPSVPSPKPPKTDDTTHRNLTASLSLQTGASLSDGRTSSKEEEDQDWARAEALRESRTVEEVTFTRAIANGMLVNFGSLVGFLPAYELSSKRRPHSFTTWAQDNGFTLKRRLKRLIPSELDVMKTLSKSPEELEKMNEDAEYKSMLHLYGNARASLLSALVGETAKVVVVTVERERKQLRFSEKEAEGEGQELAQKKAQLMTSLNVGNVVTCTVKKVTNFGAFVELQGVPALIHISELSWNRVTDPTAVLDVGQEVEVKVCRLDRYLQRINLSLKQMQPDPLRETLESLVSSDFGEILTNVKAPDDNETAEMPELIGVIKRLEAYEGINSVQKGRRIQGTALAPTFQVYLSGQLDDGFKLLARTGNQVQEVLVETVLDRESMKDAIRQCTFSDN